MTDEDKNSAAGEDAPAELSGPALRRKAEAALRERTAPLPESLAAPSPEAAEQTLHELRVHQIELEMQNEELRRMQAELAAARTRYFDLYDLAPVGYCTLSETGLILQTNLTATTMLGMARGALAKQPFSRFIFAEDEDIFYRLRKELPKSRMVQTAELRITKTEGTQFWAHLAASTVKDADGAPVVRLVLSDISVRKQAEETLRHKQLMLARTEAVAHIGSWEWHVATDTVTWSEELYRIFQHNPADGAPSFAQHAELYVPEDMLRLRDAVEAAVSYGTPYELELHAIRKDGATRLCLASGHAEIVRGGKAAKLYGSLQDITEQRLAEEARVRLVDQLRESQKMEALGTLAGGVAHDFNNVLLVIMGNVELACMDAGLGSETLASLDEIRKASGRAKALVQQILAFGRRQVLSLTPIPLAPVVEEAARLLRAAMPASVNLSVDCAPNAPIVLADASQVLQVLLNLCNNAWQAPEGNARPKAISVRLAVHVQASQAARDPRLRFVGKALSPGTYACLTVRDNAAGMDLGMMGHLFEPFYTTKRVGEGTGLGLSVVFGIAQDHGAGVEVESVPGEGSAFHIYFPAAVSQTAVASQPVASAPSAAQMRALGEQGKHILYIDDDDQVLRTMTQLLGREGYRVSAYSEGHKALEAARADPGQYDLAVTDYSMPRINGMEVARALLALRADLPVAILTGYATEALLDEAGAIGVREVIPKPNSFDELMESIARLAHETDGNKGAS